MITDREILGLMIDVWNSSTPDGLDLAKRKMNEAWDATLEEARMNDMTGSDIADILDAEALSYDERRRIQTLTPDQDAQYVANAGALRTLAARFRARRDRPHSPPKGT